MTIACFTNTGFVPSMIFIVGWFILFITIAAAIVTLQVNYIEDIKVAWGNNFPFKYTRKKLPTFLSNELPPPLKPPPPLDTSTRPVEREDVMSPSLPESPSGQRIRLDFFMKRKKTLLVPGAKLESTSVT